MFPKTQIKFFYEKKCNKMSKIQEYRCDFEYQKALTYI